jgi:hypothetical protein
MMEEVSIKLAGGAGFIGSRLCEKLYEEGHEIIVIDNLLGVNATNINATTIGTINTPQSLYATVTYANTTYAHSYGSVITPTNINATTIGTINTPQSLYTVTYANNTYAHSYGSPTITVDIPMIFKNEIIDIKKGKVYINDKLEMNPTRIGIALLKALEGYRKEDLNDVKEMFNKD